jgi:cytochrome c
MFFLSTKSIKKALVLLVLGCTIGLGFVEAQTTSGKRILVFSKTAGFRHASIPVGKSLLMKLGQENGFAVDTTENASLFTEENLKKYNAIVFLSTTGDVLNGTQQTAFERYIQAGGGWVGIHAATDTEYGWPWYNKLAGAQFASHPGNPNVQTGQAYVVNRNHPSMEGFPDKWTIKDEFYDFKNFNDKVNVLVKIDEKTYKDGKMGNNHPMAWYHEFDGGKAFYTNFGHTDETFNEPVFVKHLTGGLMWAMAPKLDYSKAYSMVAPEENRFVRKVLVDNLDEPTELVVLDDQRVLFAERKGKLKLYDPRNGKVKVVAEAPVFTKFEYGLMGLNIDPKFNENQWVYLFYSPLSSAADTAQHLSRFKYDLKKDTLLWSTEQVLLTVPVKRTDCCHTGGSVAWDAKGNLFLSTGDDTNPFQSDGYGPMDGQVGRAGFDARASSSNTNDLRGKILRITPRADSGYDIPAGNLFPKGNPKARAEIYVMGNRNPYRISVDQRTGYLYWGEVGPDAGDNREGRGSRGYDEVNQAREAGYFGWPLFVADNRAYNQYDFAAKTSGTKFDPSKPINDSPHNTGLRELPSAQKAFIYYPYANSPEFGEIVGKGGRNAMGGPVYYYDDYADSKVKFPKYYDGKFFAYDWIRGWINPVTMASNGDFISMERFMPTATFNHPMDMQFAKDGSLYMLEYGSNWFAQNDEARLSHITYNAGNRAPVAVVASDKTVGAVPLKVAFSSKGSLDYDGDAIKYEWNFGNGLPKSTVANPTFTYAKPGEYTATLKITDAKGNTATSQVGIKAGNAVPKVDIALKGNQSFFWDKKPVAYEVKINDKEDGNLAKGIEASDVLLTINYLEGFDKTMIAQGHQANTGFATGKRLIELSDCKACHSVDKKSIGPTYIEIARKYEKERNAVKTLAEKVIKGGGGVWGEQAMAAHPQLKQDEAEDMVKYILSLNSKKQVKSEALSGSYVAETKAKDGSYVFTASYIDKGNGVIGPLSGTKSIALRPAKMRAMNFDSGKDYTKNKLPMGSEVVVGTTDGGYVAYENLDLTGISKIKATVFTAKSMTVGGTLEVRVDSPTGPKIGTVEIGEETMGEVDIPIQIPADRRQRNLYLVFKKTDAKGKPLFYIDTLEFVNGAM